MSQAIELAIQVTLQDVQVELLLEKGVMQLRFSFANNSAADTTLMAQNLAFAYGLRDNRSIADILVWQTHTLFRRYLNGSGKAVVRSDGQKNGLRVTGRVERQHPTPMPPFASALVAMTAFGPNVPFYRRLQKMAAFN